MAIGLSKNAVILTVHYKTNQGEALGLRTIAAIISSILLCASYSALAQIDPNMLARAEQGDPVAQNKVGKIYAQGKEVRQDLQKAIRWFRQAASQDNGMAQFNLGLFYLKGIGVAKDRNMAFHWFTKAAKHNDREAQYNLGYMYYHGYGTSKNRAEALRLYKLAADQNLPVAQHSIGNMYFMGKGVAKNKIEAINWYKMAAEQGFEQSQHQLGYIYEYGEGVPKNYPESLKWWSLAAEQGNKIGIGTLKTWGTRYLKKHGLPLTYTVRGPAPNAASSVSNSIAAKQKNPATQSSSSPALDVQIPSGPRVALIIGNSTYDRSIGFLPNPINDANLLASTLRKVGFEVEIVVDADQKTMKRAISRLGGRMQRAGKGATGLFFFAGHGIQSRGINYLIPLNAPIVREADLELEAVAANNVLRQMEEAGNSTNIVILDACRNMPLARAFRSGVRGLARMEAPNGSFIAYSTAPGSVAADGDGDNSPFASALSRQILIPNQPVEATFREVRRDVYRQTEGLQVPWDSSSLIETFQFSQNSN